MQVPKRRNEWKGRQEPADEYLTGEAIQKLRDELAAIERARPAAVAELQRTREMGDLSENFAYHVAKGKVMAMDGNIFRIKERLKYAKEIKVGGSGGIISMGSVVTVEVNGKRKSLTILGEQEADPSSGKISYHSPIGAALMGRMVGDEVRLSINNKDVVYKIISVN